MIFAFAIHIVLPASILTGDSAVIYQKTRDWPVHVLVKLCALDCPCKFPLYAAQPGVKSHRLCDAGPAHITGEVRRLETHRSKIKAEGWGPPVTTALFGNYFIWWYVINCRGDCLNSGITRLLRTIMSWPISYCVLVKPLNNSTPWLYPRFELCSVAVWGGCLQWSQPALLSTYCASSSLVRSHIVSALGRRVNQLLNYH